MKNKKYSLVFRYTFLLMGFFAVLFILKTATVYAVPGVPKVINLQGRLLNASGNLLGGTSGTNYCFKFSLYDDAVVGGGDTRLWPASTPSTMILSVREGVFNANIGDTGAGGDTLDYNFQDNNSAYVNVEVAAQVSGSCSGVTYENLGPRQRVVSSGFAVNSGTVGGFSAAQSATGNQIPVLTSGTMILGDAAAGIKTTGTNALTFQNGVTGDIQFFGNSNKITSGGALTLAGAITSNGLTINGASTFNTDIDVVFSGTENLSLTADLGGTVDVFSLITTPSATAGTTKGLLIEQVSSANTNGLDQALVINNADTDLPIAAAIAVMSSGGGFTKLFDSPTLDITGAGAITGATGITSSGSVTFSNLTNCNTIDSNGSGQLVCGTDEGGVGGSGVSVRESDGAPSVASATTLEFGPLTSSSDEFIIADQTGGVVRISIGSQVAKLNENETITGGWSFAPGGTDDITLTLDADSDLIVNGTALSATELNVLDGGIAESEVTGEIEGVTAGNGLTGGGTADAVTLDIVSANGGIVANADNIALTLVASADGLSTTTSSGSGMEVLASGLALLQGCSDTQVLKWNETTDVWTCSADANTGVTDGDKGDITVSASGTAWTIDNTVVTFAKMQNIATDRLLGRDTTGTGSPEELTVGGGIEFTGTGIQTSAFTGDVTKTAGGTALTIAANTVDLTTDTVGNYVASTTTDVLTGLTGGSAGSEGATLALAFDYSQALSGDVGLGANAAVFGQSGMVFEGATTNLIETFIAVTDPTGTDKTITIPDRSGALSLSGDTFTGDVTGTLAANGATALTIGANTVDLTTDTVGNYVASFTAGAGLTGNATGEGSTPTLDIVSANGGIVANTDNIALTLAAAANALSTTTSSGSGMEVLASGLTLLQGCADTEILKWNETTDVWACSADANVGVTDGDKGDITVSSSGTAWTIDNTVVTFAKMQNIATDRLLGRDTTGTGSPEELTVGGGIEFTGTGIQTSAFTGDVTKTAGGTALTIAANTVDLTTDTVGNYVASTATSVLTGLTGGAAGSEGAALSLAFDYSQALTGDVGLGANAAVFGQSGLVFEGSTDNTIETFISVTDPTGADKTITIPDRSGALSLSGDTFTGDVTGTIAANGATALTIGANTVDLTTDTVGNYVASFTAGAGLTGNATGEGSTPTIDIASANGGIVANTDNLALTVAASADALSTTTSSGSGMEVLASGLTLLQGCAANEVLKWNETTDVWACSADAAGGVTDGDKGDITVSASGATWTIDNSAVTYAKIQNVATDRLLGRDAAGAGVVEELTVSGGLEFTGTGIQTSAFTGDVTKTAGGTALTIAANTVDLTTDTVGNYVASFTAGAGLTGSGTGEGSTPTLDIGAGTGITVNADTVAVNENTSFSWTADHTFTLAEAEDIALNWSVSGTQAGQAGIITVTNSSSSGNQYGLYIDNTASTGATESLLVIDNSDTDTAVTNAIEFVNAGGGFTNLFNIAGTLISSGEITLLDSGIALSELTDSGTLTATTVDINGGAIDGTTIGATTASTGVFTTLDTGQGVNELYDMDQNVLQASNVIFATTTLNNSGLHILDTNASHDLIFAVGSDLTADRTLTFTTGDANRTITLTGDTTLSGTNTGDQTSVTGNAGTVTFADAGGDTTTFVALGTSVTGSLSPATDAGLTYNATTDALTAATFIGALTGNVTGNVSGSAATVTGAAQTAITSVGTLTGLTVSGAIAANGGITFDNASDTLGAHTLSGTLDANTNILTNIGNTGTDFIASTGALTLAGVLTANGGISVAANQDITTLAGTGTLTLNSTVTNASDDAFLITPVYTGGGTDGLTYNAISIAAQTATNAAGTDTVNGLKIGNLTEAGAGVITSSAINLGSGWDFVIDNNGTTLTATELNVLDGGIAESEVTGEIEGVTAGNGLTGGGTTDSVTLDIVSANGGIVANTDNIALTLAAAANALSTTTSSGSGMEVLASGLTLLQGCADTEILKWNETTDVWACGADVAGGSASLSGLTAAVAANLIDNLAHAQEWQWNTLAGGTGLKLSSSSTAATANTQKLFEVALSGANATLAQTTYGGYFTNTHTNATSGTNVALYASASGATTANYAAIFNGGRVVIGTNTATSMLHVETGANADQTGLMIRGGEPDIVMNQTTAGGYATATFQRNGTATVGFGMNNNDDMYMFRNNSGVYTDNSFVLKKVTGNIGLGVTDPGSRLSMANSISDTGQVQDVDLVLTDDINVDTISGINIDVTSAATGDADILYGLNINNVTAADATVLERAIRIGSGWDEVIDNNGTLISGAELNVLDGGIAESEVTGEIEGVTAGNGLTGGGTTDSVTLDIVSANGGIVANTDNIALTLAAAANALSTTTSSGSGMEVLASGLTLLQGCADTEILKWNETTDVWACSADLAGGGGATLQTAYDGGTPTILTDASGDIIFQVIGGATDTQFEINAASAPEIDMMLISNAAQGTVTAGVNGLQIDFTTGDGASVTNSGLEINMVTGGTAAADIANALNITVGASDASTQNGIMIGRGFDLGLSIKSGGISLDASNINFTQEGGALGIGSGSPPSAPTVALGAAGVLSGTYSYCVTFVTAEGESQCGYVSSSIAPASQQVNLTAIPIGTAGVVTARRIYRAKAYPGGTTFFNYQLVATGTCATAMGDNTTTSCTDNTADSAVTVVAPMTNTTASIGTKAGGAPGDFVLGGGPYADVRAFGAKCDGINDDTGEIQSALDSLVLTGGIVQLPIGQCRITSTIYVKNSSTTFRGLGAYGNDDASAISSRGSTLVWDTPIDGSPSSTPMVKVGPNALGTTLPSLKRISMHDMNFECAGKAGIGLEVESVHYSSFRNLYFRNCATTAIHLDTVSGSLGEATDTTRNEFSNIGIRQLDSSTVNTTINGAGTLPLATITVVSTTGFVSGTNILSIFSGQGNSQIVTCTGITATTFTGCTGGTGAIAVGHRVAVYGPASASGIRLDGQDTSSPVGNTSVNSFHNIAILHAHGTALMFLNSDTNRFYGVATNRGNFSGLSAEFSAATTVAKTARGNVFYAYDPGPPGSSTTTQIIARGTTSSTIASANNTFYELIRENSTRIPTIEAGATLYYSSGRDLSSYIIGAGGADTSAFGLLVSAGGFMANNSYFGEEFMADTLDTAVTVDNATVGDNGTWYADTTSALWTISQGIDRTNGTLRAVSTNTAVAAIEFALGQAQNVLQKPFLKANLPVAQIKFQTSNIAGTTSDYYIGMTDTTIAVATNDTLPVNGIYFTNSNTGNWFGQIRSASGTVGTTASCGAMTTTATVFRIEVLSTTEVRFLIDTNATDGINFVNCGSITGAGPLAIQLGPTVHVIQVDTAQDPTIDLDYFRVWQDDSAPIEGEETQSSDAPLTVDSVASAPFDARVALMDLLSQEDALANSVNVQQFNTDRLVAGLEVVTPKVITAGLTVDSITSLKDAVTFNSDTVFLGTPYFNADTAGFALVKTGDKKVTVVFDKPYAVEPVVNASVTFENDDKVDTAGAEALFAADIRSLIVEKNLKGFTILLNKPAPQNMRFSWVALAVKDAKTTESVIEGLTIQAPGASAPGATPSTPEESTENPSQEPITETSSDEPISTEPPVTEEKTEPVSEPESEPTDSFPPVTAENATEPI